MTRHPTGPVGLKIETVMAAIEINVELVRLLRIP